MLTHRAFHCLGMIVFLVAALVLLAGCGNGPKATNVEGDVRARIAQAFDGAVRLDGFRRAGGGPLPASAEGERRIVYYNATLAVERDIDLSSWQGLNLGAVAGILGATERGISGLTPGGNKKGDVLRVHGTVTYVNDNGQWRPVRTVQIPVAAPPPEDNTGPPADALRIVENIRSLFEKDRGIPQRRNIITDELENAYFHMRLRLDRVEGAVAILGGPEAGEYNQVAGLIAVALQQVGMQGRAVITDGSVENLRLLGVGQGDVALAQNNVALAAVNGRSPFAGDAAVADLRALASLFPEEVHVIVSPGANISNLADLKGKRVDIGQPASGTHIDAEALLAAGGLSIADLAEASERGLAEGLKALKRNELDVVIATIGAPARSIQALTEGSGLTFLSLSEAEQARLTAAGSGAASGYVAVTMPAGTYSGQDQPVRTVAAAALLVTRAPLSDDEVITILRQVFDGIDFFAAGSAAGSQISRANAKTGVTIPWHPAAERFFEGKK